MKIIERSMSGKSLIVVDVQPEYKKFMPSKLVDNLIRYINENFDKLHQVFFLYNGEDLGMIFEDDYKYWLLENGLDEGIIDHFQFFDKGYAFFRNIMDQGFDDDAIGVLIQYMIKHKITDSRDMDDGDWDSYLKEKDSDVDVKEFIKDNEDSIYIPELVDFLKPINNIALCGGGVDECLKEVEFVLNALKKPYELIKRYTY